jgi:hypothetical protein
MTRDNRITSAIPEPTQRLLAKLASLELREHFRNPGHITNIRVRGALTAMAGLKSLRSEEPLKARRTRLLEELNEADAKLAAGMSVFSCSPMLSWDDSVKAKQVWRSCLAELAALYLCELNDSSSGWRLLALDPERSHREDHDAPGVDWVFLARIIGALEMVGSDADEDLGDIAYSRETMINVFGPAIETANGARYDVVSTDRWASDRLAQSQEDEK